MIQVQRGMHRFVQAPDYSQLHRGYAAGGPQDRFSCGLANRMVGNQVFAGAIELTLAPAVLRIENACHLVVGGAPCDVSVDGNSQPTWTVLRAAAGAEVKITIGQTGCRVYVCVAGGLDVDGRFSGDPMDTDRFAKEVGQTKQGDVFDWAPAIGTVRILPTAEWSDSFARHLTGRSWEISPQSNSVGLRLIGPALPLKSFDILSSPVQDGTIQATRSGLLALLRDRGTLGGYPRVANVIDCDVDRLAQFRPGQQLRFEQVDRVTAGEMCDRQQRHFKRSAV